MRTYIIRCWAQAAFVILSLLGLGLQAQNPVRIDAQAPKKVMSGEDMPLTLQIEKQDLAAFAGLTMTLPGTAEPEILEYGGAEFRMEGKKAIFTWLKLPVESPQEIKLRLPVKASYGKRMVLTGRLTYQINNHLGEVLMDPIFVKIPDGEEKEPAPQTEAQPEENMQPEEKPRAEASSEGAQAEKQQQAAEIQAVRLISKNEGDYAIRVQLSKGKLTTPATWAERIPTGYKFSGLNAPGDYQMKMEEGLVKIIWDELPNKAMLEAEYMLTPKTGTKEEPEFSGSFSTQVNGKTKSVTLLSKSIAPDKRVEEAQDLWGN